MAYTTDKITSMAVQIARKAPSCRALVSAIAISCSLPITMVMSATAAELTGNNQQWVCQPSNSEWQCQSEPSNSSQPAIKSIGSGAKSSTIASSAQTTPATASAQWDWVSKAQLSDPSICKTGCDGAYVEPTIDWDDSQGDPANAALTADADSSEMIGQTVKLEGDVVLTQGNRSIRADSVELDRSSNDLRVSGNVEIREPDLLIRGDNAQINTETRLGSVDNSQVLNHSTGFRANAKYLARESLNTLDLERSSVTQCTPDDEVWQLHADSIHLDYDGGWGKAKHARLEIYDVPVFYSPSLTFPIDDRRLSGFLWPTISSGSDSGFELSAPYYFNLAPNYDLTLAPRYIEKRGTLLEAEARQLGQYGQWVFGGAILGQDDMYQENPAPDVIDDVPPREKRWLGTIKQQGQVLGFNTRIDFNKVSDNDFFRDLSTDSLELKRTTHLNQQATISRANSNWSMSLTAQDHQTIDELIAQQYQLMPQFEVQYSSSAANFQPDWQLQAQITDFQHDQSIDNGGLFETGQRNFAEAGVSYPMRWAPGFIIPSAKVRNVSYELDESLAGNSDNPSATVPLATLDMGLIFERDANFSDSKYLQTLEPRLYYFYSDFEAQDSNPDFDSKELDFSYSQLFRDTRFSGHDRLDDANQVSLGVTSRFINNAEGREVLTLSIGQTFYLDDRKVQLNRLIPDDELSNSNIASEIQYQPSDNLWISNNLLWDSRRDKLEEGGISFHYQSSANSLYNLGYRYRRNGGTSFAGLQSDLAQVDASVVYPLNERWSLFSRYLYDTENHRGLEEMAGLQYEDCCWVLRVLYQQGIEDEFVDNNNDITADQHYAFIVEFQLKGLGSLGNKARSLLEESILGYEDLD
ncbi:MAG: LPS-assembly protein [Oceanicoccus sp.]|jgi:LPS-assembly protein